MKEIKNKLHADIYKYPYDRFGDMKDLLFVDIETTGFKAATSKLYLIGVVYYEEEEFWARQWFAETPEEEELLLYSFFHFAEDKKLLIHFNGNRFDIPYMQDKIEQLSLPFDFSRFEGVDIYKRIRPYKNLLKLSGVKQRDIEALMGIERKDEYDGGSLIKIYEDYLVTPAEDSLQLLLNHNLCDLQGLLSIVPILAVSDLFNKPVRVTRAGRNPYVDMDGNEKAEVVMELSLPTAMPIAISYGFADCYFTAEDMKGKLKVAIEECELKYFHTDYKDYYYLPDEDMAVHKSVSSYVDASRREQAKASNCYTKKSGVYLPQWEPLFTPAFKKDYKDKTTYFEMTDEFKRSSDSFTKYAKHLLEILAL